MNALHQDLLNQNINNVKIIAIGKGQYSSNNSNWTDMIAVEVDGVVLIDPLVATPSNPPAFNTTEDADSATIGTQSALPITWPSNIKWNGGSAPTLYSEVGAINQF